HGEGLSPVVSNEHVQDALPGFDLVPSGRQSADAGRYLVSNRYGHPCARRIGDPSCPDLASVGRRIVEAVAYHVVLYGFYDEIAGDPENAADDERKQHERRSEAPPQRALRGHRDRPGDSPPRLPSPAWGGRTACPAAGERHGCGFAAHRWWDGRRPIIHAPGPRA